MVSFICSCAYYQEILISWILWELCPFELRNFLKFTKFPGDIMHNYIWCPYYLPSFMKFCSVISEKLCWQTVWRTDRQTDGQDKNNMSPHQSGGRRNYPHCLCIWAENMYLLFSLKWAKTMHLKFAQRDYTLSLKPPFCSLYWVVKSLFCRF
jgi:hypothetical protein